MLTSYEISATDAGTAIAVATQRGHADGWTHVSITGVRQTASTTFVVSVFVSNSQGVTKR